MYKRPVKNYRPPPGQIRAQTARIFYGYHPESGKVVDVLVLSEDNRSELEWSLVLPSEPWPASSGSCYGHWMKRSIPELTPEGQFAFMLLGEKGFHDND